MVGNVLKHRQFEVDAGFLDADHAPHSFDDHDVLLGDHDERHKHFGHWCG